jgi:U3 small nucleolar RNA-associated protein 7
MITLDPEFVGSLAPPSKLTTETTFDGKPTVEIPYARLPRLERLKVSGKADETEVDNEEWDADDPNATKKDREEREKRKMRGKGKSLKRFAYSASYPYNFYCYMLYRYLRKKRKNVIDPAAVSSILIFLLQTRIDFDIRRLRYGPNWISRESRSFKPGELSKAVTQKRSHRL